MQDSENNWQFDIFSLAEETPGCTLSLLAAHLFAASGICDEFGIDTGKLMKYLRKIESGYNAANPYHNRQASTPDQPADAQQEFMQHVLCHIQSVLDASVLLVNTSFCCQPALLYALSQHHTPINIWLDVALCLCDAAKC